MYEGDRLYTFVWHVICSCNGIYMKIVQVGVDGVGQSQQSNKWSQMECFVWCSSGQLCSQQAQENVVAQRTGIGTSKTCYLRIRNPQWLFRAGLMASQRSFKNGLNKPTTTSRNGLRKPQPNLRKALQVPQRPIEIGLQKLLKWSSSSGIPHMQNGLKLMT